jgi:hypothetical protein
MMRKSQKKSLEETVPFRTLWSTCSNLKLGRNRSVCRMDSQQSELSIMCYYKKEANTSMNLKERFGAQ